ncbi:MAG TPA: hypothetical protein VGX00_05470 [Thermoplasmata archaeon]|nr:hypothetical protein [Thermoplasmata archaeon]
MAVCQNTFAAEYAFPPTAGPVMDRRMTLTIPCRELATSTLDLTSASNGRARDGATAKKFFLCENHASLYSQIDTELVEDGWAPAHSGRPIPLP